MSDEDNVVRPSFPTTQPIEPDIVLQGPVRLLSEVLVIGWIRGEGRLYFGASDPDMSRALMLLEMAKKQILERMEH